MKLSRVESRDVIFMEAFSTYVTKADDDWSSESLVEYNQVKRKEVRRWLSILDDRDTREKLNLVVREFKCSKFESYAFACVLEDASDKLDSLGGNDMKPRPALFSFEHLQEVRKSKFDADSMKPTHLPETKRRYHEMNFQVDRRYWKRTLFETRYDLMDRQCFTATLETHRFLKHEIKARKAVFQANIDQKNLLRAQNAIISVETYIGNTHCDILDKRLGKLRTKVHDNNVLSQIALRTISKYEAARKEQHNLKLTNAEKSIENSTKNNREQMKSDNRIHSEITEYLRRQINGYQNQVKQWSEKYDSEIEEFDTMIIMRKEALELIRKELEQMRRIYDDRQLRIEEYLEIKHGREMMDRKAHMSLVLQSWWRGLAFRKRLMPKRRRKAQKKQKKNE